MSTTALKRAIKIVGTQAELARRIHREQSHVWNWLNRDNRVAADAVIAIETATDGQVTRHELRPDVFGKAA